jgi:hypothetical protein
MKNNLLKWCLSIALIGLAGTGIINAQQCPSDIISYWKLDGSSETILTDDISAHTATATTTLTSITGKVGNAKYFDGSDVVNVANHADFNFTSTSSFSIELWVNFTDVDFGERNKVFIGNNDPYNGGGFWFIGAEFNTGKVIFYLKDSNGNDQQITSSNAYNNGAWHHIVAIRDKSTNTNSLYIDGTLVGSAVYNYTGSFVSSNPINIGYLLRDDAPDYFFNGNIDEIAIYKKALPVSEITGHISKAAYSLGYCDTFAPVITSSPVNKAQVGVEYKYQVVAKGIPTIKYYLVSKPANMSIDEASGLITWTPSSNTVDALVKVRADNNVAPADTQSFRVFIGNTPECPSNILLLLKLDEQSGPTYSDYYAVHDAVATVNPTAATGVIDGGQTFGATTKLDIPDNRFFEWTPSNNFSFEYWMKTSTTGTMVCLGRHREDEPNLATWWIGTDASGYASFFLRDNGGTFVQISGETALSDGNWHYIVAVRDGSANINRLYVDGVKVASISQSYSNSFKADNTTEVNVGWYDVSATGYHFIGTLDEVAIYTKALTDNDVQTYYNNGLATGRCSVSNYAPAITSTPVTEATEDVAYSCQFTVEDIDATDVITLSAPTHPNWLTFNYTAGQKTATITGTPTNDNVGNHDVVLRVSDGTVNKEQSFSITVTNVNDAPVITSTAITTGVAGVAYSYTFTASDVDNPTLVLSYVTKPDWLTFNASTGVLSGTPAIADQGNASVTLRASDGILNADQSFTILVGPSAVQELKDVGIQVYPIPAKEFLTIQFGNQYQETQLELISATGNVVLRTVIPANQNDCTLNLKNVNSGIYFLHVVNNQLNGVGKIVITK